MEVAEQDSGLRASDDQNNEDKEQEAKHVVHLMGPGGQKETYLRPAQATGHTGDKTDHWMDMDV